MKSDDNISEKRNSPTVVVEYFFVDYAILRFFSISMKITTKVPICSRIGPEKVPILPESPFFPYYNILQHIVPMAKFCIAATAYNIVIFTYLERNRNWLINLRRYHFELLILKLINME